MDPSKYADVRRFYVQKYGKRVGALKFQVYLLKKKKRKSPAATADTRPKKRTSRFRINIFKF